MAASALRPGGPSGRTASAHPLAGHDDLLRRLRSAVPGTLPRGSRGSAQQQATRRQVSPRSRTIRLAANLLRSRGIDSRPAPEFVDGLVTFVDERWLDRRRRATATASHCIFGGFHAHSSYEQIHVGPGRGGVSGGFDGIGGGARGGGSAGSRGGSLRKLGSRPRHARHLGQSGRRLPTLCGRQVARHASDPGGQVAKRRRIGARRPQPGATARHRDGRAEGQPARRIIRQLHGRGAARAARRGSAEVRPRPRRGDRDKGRVHPFHGRLACRLWRDPVRSRRAAGPG